MLLLYYILYKGYFGIIWIERRPLLHNQKDGLLMKFKKSITTFIMVAMVLVLAQSAFALPGMGDTMEKAIKIEPGVKLNGVLQDANDYDWYTWENKSGKNRYAYFQVTTPSEDSGALLGAVVVYPLGFNSSPFFADPTQRRHQNLSTILVPPTIN
ncbi:hypothetical protein DOE73_27395, partial [Paenibacillus dendritiformis]